MKKIILSKSRNKRFLSLGENNVFTKICLFNVLERISLSYLVFFFGVLVLLLNPIFYLILFKITGIDLPINMLFSYSLDLIGFFIYLSPLDSAVWTAKEILHYIDVRSILDLFYNGFLFCLIFIVFNFKKINFSNLKFVSRYLKYIILFPLVTLPFFNYFWNNIFHPLLFSNDLWLMYPGDLSYYIFNEWFFALFYISFVLVEFLFFWIIDKHFKL
jgi:hypothetical protein